MAMYLSPRGYVIPKETLSIEQVAALHKDLIVSPIVISGYGNDSQITFKCYQESTTKYYLPKCYGLKTFGLPTHSKLPDGQDIDVNFDGELRPIQEEAIKCVMKALRDPCKTGAILCLGCGFGKTVVAIKIMSLIRKKTLVVVHKDFLLQQWKERIGEFLPGTKVGTIKAKTIDVQDKDVVIASLQSLSMKEYSEDLFNDFGFAIFDECHHTSAEVFSQALRKLCIKYTLGLTATPKRKDGLTKVFLHHLGDIEYSSGKRKDNMRVIFKEFYSIDPLYSKEYLLYSKKPNIARMLTNICDYQPRTDFIVDILCDILKDEPDRKCLVLTDRRDQVENLAAKLKGRSIEVGLYYGGMKDKDLKESETKRVIVGSYSYVSEGFDVKALNTLLLASPKTDVVQIVGRILREKPEERAHTPLVIDIVDAFSVFPNQGKRRMTYYKSCKYDVEDPDKVFTKVNKNISLGDKACFIDE